MKIDFQVMLNLLKQNVHEVEPTYGAGNSIICLWGKRLVYTPWHYFFLSDYTVRGCFIVNSAGERMNEISSARLKKYRNEIRFFVKQEKV